MKKPLYDDEYKKKTVQYVKESGKAVAEVARELKIKDNTLYGWMKKFGSEPEIVQNQVFKSENHQLRELQKQIRELQEENEILKKGNALLRERPSVKYSFVHENRSEYRLEKMCKVMNVSRSGYYKWRDRPESERERQHKEWTEQVKEVFDDSRQLYGSPKVTQKLNQQGVSISERTVTRIMKKQEWRSRTVKKYKATTNSKHSLPVQDNVLNQDFTASKPNEKWVTDITYVATGEGWLYLASVMDLYSRKIVGWHMSDRMTKELVLQALRQAYGRQQPDGEVLHHSDRGSQYASHDYQKQLQVYSMTGSMSRKGNCYDNACIESFHSIIKKELIYLNKFETRAEAEKSIFEYIEVFYNNERIHSTIGYCTPSDFERQHYFNTVNH
ncbi:MULTISPECIES: IS3 family transposase [Paenibacillaceae]|uniref:IS3 family transposase n=1 Tax=Marinicrinis lubricantis TaxID=2086470 RepID=A0ABW1IJ62_9BACL|nr:MULTISPECIES: IS3 family transposase [Paenibacillus]MCT2195985.1 IS3 family transposase [Paenibacillus sp. p3-SID1389]